MAISSIGVGSGLDVESIITQMVALEKAPITTLTAKAEVIQSKISTYGQVKSLVDDLNSAVRDLTLDRTWGTMKISSSGSGVSASMSGLAQAGSYNVNVTQLAQSQTAVSSTFAAKATMGSVGTMVLSIGNPDKQGVVLKNVSVAIEASDTLEQVASKISSSDAGVLASVITAADGSQQLMLRSRETGLDTQFSVAVEGAAAGSNLEVLGGAATLDANGQVSGTGLAKAQEAKNAVMTLNGVKLESNTNSFADTLPGLTVSVSALGSSLLSVNQDKEAVQTSIQKFVDAYNAVNELLSASTKYTADTGAAGVLQGDSSTVSLQNSLRMLTQGIASNASGAFSRLADIGISMAQGGALTVDSTKLTTALNDVASIKQLFASPADSLGQGGGIGVNFKSFTDQLLAYDGTLNTKSDSLETQLKRNSTEQEKVNTRAETVEARLRTQYTALDVKMSSLTALNSYVEQMVASWNSSDD